MLHSFEQNTKGKDFVVGDIHGCFGTLQRTLDYLGFNPEVDRLFSVGDLVDRGPESIKVLEWLAKPWFFAVRGNHDQMAIDYLTNGFDRWIYSANGGQWFMALGAQGLEHIQKAIVEAFEKLPFAIEIVRDTGKVGIIHANWPVQIANWEDLVDSVNGDMGHYYLDDIIWGRGRIRNGDTSGVEGLEKLYVGHSIVKEKIILGNIHYIDTGAFKTDMLWVEEI